MEVETYEETEMTAEGIPEPEEEAIALIESLGLEGQKSLIHTSDDGEETKQRCPYRRMTTEEEFVYGTLCQEKSKLEEYDAGPIPVRVLQVAAHAVGMEFFSRIRIWHKPINTPDPVLVGVTETDNGRRHYWLLARWGSELRPFGELFEKAIDIHRKKLVAAAASVKAKAERTMAVVEVSSDSELLKIREMSCYGEV